MKHFYSLDYVYNFLDNYWVIENFFYNFTNNQWTSLQTLLSAKLFNFLDKQNKQI